MAKKGWKTALVVGLSILTVAGAAAAGVSLFSPAKTKKVNRTMWSVGSVNADGAVSTANKTSIVTDLFGCDGLTIDIAENEFKGTYSVYFYTLKGGYLTPIENLSSDKDEETLSVPLGATCRVVYTPQLAEGDKIYFWEIGSFADDLVITYNRTQESVLDKCSIEEKTVGNVYSMTEYNGALYAGMGSKYLLTTTNGSDWKRVGNEPCKSGQISQLAVYNNILYGVSTGEGVFAYNANANAESGTNKGDFVVYEGEYGTGSTVTSTYFSLHSEAIRSLAVMNGKLFAFGAHDKEATSGVMEDGEYKRVNISPSNVYVMTDEGCWVALPSPGDAESFTDAVYVDGKYIFVGVDGGVFSSTDLTTWYDHSKDEYGDIQSIYYDGQNFIFGGEDGKMYVGTSIELMHKAYTNSTMATEYVRMIEGFDGNVYAVAYSADGEAGELWKSEDHGATWRVIVDGFEGFYSLSVMRGTLYVGGKNVIYYLGDLK